MCPEGHLSGDGEDGSGRSSSSAALPPQFFLKDEVALQSVLRRTRRRNARELRTRKKDERPCLGAQHETKARPTDPLRPAAAVSRTAVSRTGVSSAVVSSRARPLSSFSPPHSLPQQLCLSPSRSTAVMAEAALIPPLRIAPVRRCPRLMPPLLACKLRRPHITLPPRVDPHIRAAPHTAALRPALRRAPTSPLRTAIPQLPSPRERRRA